jgi:23S rRNA (adenine2503-C2)-methyltransferase
MMTESKVDLKNLTPEELTDFLRGMGKETYRTSQLLGWIYRRGVTDFSKMTNLAQSFRQELQQRATVSSLIEEKVELSRDGTRKFLFRLADGKFIESVLIPMETGRNTLCISTQVGCAMQCSFCLTGTFGLERNLEVAEIVNQVSEVRNKFPVDNIVMMGMGEPLHNLDNVVNALNILYAEAGFNYSPRKITLSTAGLVPAIIELGKRVKVNLAISLNATTNELRDQLMPINRRYNLETLMAACRSYPLDSRQRITFEYILIRDLNDRLADAKRLVQLLHGIKAKVNLIPYNEHEGSNFKTPERATVEAFQSYLLKRNLVAIRRASKGVDISAACGQLKGKSIHDANSLASSRM